MAGRGGGLTPSPDWAIARGAQSGKRCGRDAACAAVMQQPPPHWRVTPAVPAPSSIALTSPTNATIVNAFTE
jgi:hypothetical protein